MKKTTLKWLLEIADRKPLLFSVAILLIAVSSEAVIVKNRDSKIDECNHQRENLEKYYNLKLDSLDAYYRRREITLNTEVKQTLNQIIEDYKHQVDEQKNLNKKVNSSLTKNREIINQNKQQLKSLKR
jgi:hypothetical protein